MYITYMLTHLDNLHKNKTIGYRIVLFVVFNRWIPIFKFSIKRYKEMRSFGNNMLLSYLSNQFGDNLYAVIIGKFHRIFFKTTISIILVI